MAQRALSARARITHDSPLWLQAVCSQCRYVSMWAKAPTTRSKEMHSRFQTKDSIWRRATETRYEKRSAKNREEAVYSEASGGLIPYDVLLAAHRAGFLHMPPSKAHSIVRQFNISGDLTSTTLIIQVAKGNWFYNSHVI
jgi:hypothetical protein